MLSGEIEGMFSWKIEDVLSVRIEDGIEDKSLLSFNLLHSVSWIKFVVTHSSDRCQLNSINTKLGLV